MKEIIFSRAKNNLCPICNKPIDKDFFLIAYNGEQLKVCKNHIKYGENNEKKNSSVK